MMVEGRQEEGTGEGDHTRGIAQRTPLRIHGAGCRKEDWVCWDSSRPG